MKRLTHLDGRGKARMVDVSAKPVTAREAVARATVIMKKETLAMIAGGNMPKGDVFAVARVAGILAAKGTAGLIPLCHPIAVSSVQVDFSPDGRKGAVVVEARVKTAGQTGVEMEALVAVSMASLTVYDMCKAVDKGITITDIMLLEKHGGKSGSFRRA